jgi:hypothetical protein
VITVDGTSRDGDRDRPRHDRRRSRSRAAAIAALTLVIAASVALARCRSAEPPSAQTAGNAATTASRSAPASQQPPRTASSPAFDDLAWVTVAGVEVPVSASAGPHNTSNGRARGFAHDLPGAVLAAIHLTIRLTPQAGPKVFEPTLRDQVVPDSPTSPDVEALRVTLEADYEQLRRQIGTAAGAPVGRLSTVLRGYQVSDPAVSGTAPDAADVRLLTESTSTTGGSLLAATSVTVRWTNSDWAVVAPPGGGWSALVQPVTSRAGYTPLSPPDPAGSR